MDAEEALRTLMVRVFPRALRSESQPNDLAEAIPEMIKAVAHGPLGDLRYIDCLNCLFEAWGAGADAAFLASYRDALGRQIDALKSSDWQPARLAPAPQPFRPPLLDGVGPQLSVLVLASSIRAASRIHEHIAALPAVHSRILCAGSGGRRARFFARALLDLAGTLLRRPRFLGAWLSGAVKLTSRSLDDQATLEWIRAGSFDLGLHAAGFIYRKRHIDAFRAGILNSHIGLLPEYRGRCVMEWSLLAGHETGVSVFLIDEGIDTGECIVFRAGVDVADQSTLARAKAQLFALDGHMYAKALAALSAKTGALRNVRIGRRYYVMSALLQGVLETAQAMRSIASSAR